MMFYSQNDLAKTFDLDFDLKEDEPTPPPKEEAKENAN